MEHGSTTRSLARGDALLEETPLHGIAGQLERDDKMFACVLKMAAAKFANRCVVKEVVGQTLRVLNRMDLRLTRAVAPQSEKCGTRLAHRQVENLSKTVVF